MSRRDDVNAICARRAAPCGRASGRAADRQRIDAQRRLTDADGDALTVLAAGADAIVQLQVVADHGNARQYVRAVADESRALEWRAQAAVLDRVRLARREHEFARGYIDLAPPKLTA